MQKVWIGSNSSTTNKEFGDNLLLEVVVMTGEQVLGQKNQKKKRPGSNMITTK